MMLTHAPAHSVTPACMRNREAISWSISVPTKHTYKSPVAACSTRARCAQGNICMLFPNKVSGSCGLIKSGVKTLLPAARSSWNIGVSAGSKYEDFSILLATKELPLHDMLVWDLLSAAGKAAILEKFVRFGPAFNTGQSRMRRTCLGPSEASASRRRPRSHIRAAFLVEESQVAEASDDDENSSLNLAVGLSFSTFRVVVAACS
jgi:hypothetical protein